MAKYKKTFTSGAKLTSTANKVHTFEPTVDVYAYNDTIEYNSVEFLAFETFGTACRIKINDEDTIHWIDAESKLVLSDIMIYKLTILDAGVEYYFTAMSVN